MRDRFRNFDSKISFFAFADIITSVCGVLIFITLLLATDLEKRVSEGHGEDSGLENKLSETLRQQTEIDAYNSKLQSLLALAQTAPSTEKLESDIARLRNQLGDENRKHTDATEQLASSQMAIEARDRALGLTDLKAQIQRVIHDSETLAQEEAKVREEMARLDQRVESIQSKILKLRAREGQLWLIPDKSSTTKEPILVTVSRTGAKIEKFDRPNEAQMFDTSTALSGLEQYLQRAKPLDQYVVFLIRPSGIQLFEHLVKQARDSGFDVGFDALEENREVHFTSPPSLDEVPAQTRAPDTQNASASPTPAPANLSPSNSILAANPVSNPPSAPAVTGKPVSVPKSKSWWRRFLEFIGIA